MQKTLKNFEIINAVESIKMLLMLDGLSTKLNYNLNKNLIRLEPSYKAYTVCEKELVEKYALKEEDGALKLDENQQPKFPPNSLSKYLKEREELLICEDTVDIYEVNLSSLPDNIGKGITLYSLMFLIKDDLE